MSCLNLKGLFPTTKVLKLLSTKLIPFKLHRLNRSKVIKKQRKTMTTFGDNKTTTKKGGRWPKLTGRAKRKKFQFKTVKKLDFHKKPAPVYIDQLFVETGATVKEHKKLCLPDLKKDDREEASMAAGFEDFDDRPAMAGYEDVGERSAMAGYEDVGERSGEADDMWEAITMASPEMHGINERAEEFISNFRAEMKRQETMDKRL